MIPTSLLLLAIFVATFNPNVNNWWVNAAWFAAVGTWWLRFSREGPASKPETLGRGAWQAFAVFAVVFAATWLPFYDNWRWVKAGDSVGIFSFAQGAATRGLPFSFLNCDFYPYMSWFMDSSLMFLIEPTLFWHRVSKLIISLAALASIYGFFSLMVGWPWSLAIVAVTASTPNWLYISHTSYPNTDQYICAYLALIALTLIFRQPERLARWVALGLVSGLSLQFTQSGWAEVIACAVVVAVWAVANGRLKPLGICGLSFLIAGLPMLMQLHALVNTATIQTRVVWEWEYNLRILRSILYLPAGGTWTEMYIQSPVAGWPCGYFYAAGLGVAALGAVPVVRRRLGLSIAVVGLLVMFFAEAVVMAVTNNLNGVPSPKRTDHLIPLQAFFGILPFYAAAALVRGSKLLRRFIGVAAGIAVGAYVLEGALLMILPERFHYDDDVYGSLVQVRQRFADRRALVLAPHIKTEIDNPESLFNRTYHVSDTVSVVSELDSTAADRACTERSLLCCLTSPKEQEELRAATGNRQLRKVALSGSSELECFECA